MSEHRLQIANDAPVALSDTQLAYATWAAITTGCDEAAHQLVATYGPVTALQRAQHWLARPNSAGRFENAVRRWAPNLRHVALAQLVLTHRHRDGVLLTPADSTWPRRLRDLGMREPFALWLRGSHARQLSSSCAPIALVGARSCTPAGAQIAAQLAYELAAAGHPIISGGGIGIDAAVHRAALEAGGTTFAILAGGLDRPYPAVHRELFQQIAQAGLLISEAPPTIRPNRGAFLHRMRLVAALAGALVIVQTPPRGGALVAADEAAALARPVGAVPGAVSDMAHAGCLTLIRSGKATLVRDARDIAALLQSASRAPTR